MNSPFHENAAHYWAAQLSAIPLELGTKQPARGIRNWTGFCDNLPKPETRQQWMRTYSACGIGLCLGTPVTPEFRLAAVDVDVDSLVAIVRSILGICPCAKRGKKGITYFVRVPRNSKVRSCKIVDHAKVGVIDVLVGGRMTVLPPTKHPNTGAPYVWEGSELLKTKFQDLPILDDQTLALAKFMAGSEEAIDLATTLATGEATHEAGLRLVAMLVRRNIDDTSITKFVCGLLPSTYKGNSLHELPEWIASARKKGFDTGDSGTKKPKSTATRLVELFHNSGAALFHDPGKRGFMSIPAANGGVRHLALRSTEGRLWLTKLMFDAVGQPPGARPLDEAINLLDAQARFSGEECKTFLRIGGDSRRIMLDLGHDDGRVVTITAAGREVGYDTDIKFIRSPGFAKLPIPKRGDLTKLKELLNISQQAWTLVLAFLIGCLQPSGPYMLLLVEGEQGSGKSMLCQFIKRIIDPNQIEKARLPDSERDLMIHAKDFYLPVFDNVGGMKGDLSDALCVLATGGGLGTRKLYSDDELYIFNSTRPVIINGIADFANRPDLLERSIILRLPAMSERQRKTEADMLQELERILPNILGALCDIAAGALKTRTNRPAPASFRMADYAQWLVAAEKHTDLTAGSFMKAIVQSQEETVIERAHNDPVFIGVLPNYRMARISTSVVPSPATSPRLFPISARASGEA